MIYKLGNVADMSKLPSMDDRLRNAIFKNLKILDDNYGEDRDIDNDDGGYVLFCEPGTTEEEIQSYYDHEQFLPEHVLPVISNPPYIETLYLISNDYGIVLFTKYADTPDDILEEMDDE